MRGRNRPANVGGAVRGQKQQHSEQLFWKHYQVFWTSGALLSDQILKNNWTQTSDPKFADVTTPYTGALSGNRT